MEKRQAKARFQFRMREPSPYAGAAAAAAGVGAGAGAGGARKKKAKASRRNTRFTAAAMEFYMSAAAASSVVPGTGVDVHARLRRNWPQLHWIRGERVLHAVCVHRDAADLVHI